MKRDQLPSNAIPRARKLRRTATEAETILGRALREKLLYAKFRRQVPLGPYFADFASHGMRLVIEADGGQHDEAAGYDAARTRFLESEGYRVLRFSNHDVIENLDGVLDAIERALTPHPSATSERSQVFLSFSHKGRRIMSHRRIALVLPLLLSACATQRGDAVAASAPGFLFGLWHGFVFPVAWVISLFDSGVAVYAVPNNGGWYDFGYFLGIVVFGVGARKTRTVYRTRTIRAAPAQRESVIIDQ